MKSLFLALFSILAMGILPSVVLSELKVGDRAPDFSTQTHLGEMFSMAQQKGRWTVLYFYPKADTPGCTKQACAFRDSVKVITNLGADIYGISGDEQKVIQEFHLKHHLNFTLLSDAKADVMKAYGAKIIGMNMSKRWTFIIDPELKIRHINTDVDPVKDADSTAKVIKDLKAKKL